ncbi:MAG: electron transport complex subunit E [Halochromatium sp.]|uniref:electron transport complex subunit E n=1 Tax=Halochromatium sp. TaxID=2049430 RepID=UPI00397B8FCB
MAEKGYGALIGDGLWSNNQALVALLGLCPLLAVTTTATNGLGMGLATTTVIVLSNATVSLIRNLVRPEVRLPVFVLVIASFVTAVELTMQAQFYGLYLVLGLFIPLIVTNCAIIGRAEAFASKAPLDRAIVDGLAMGLGFTLVLMVLGGLREFLGQGTLFYQADLLLGAGAKDFGLEFGEDFQGALLAILPPGAFIGLGIMIALKNLIDKRIERLRQMLGSVSAKRTAARAPAGEGAPSNG